MTPDAPTCHDADPERLRALIAAAGLPYATVARATGTSVRTLERYLSPTAVARGDRIPYPLQFTIEALCAKGLQCGS